MGFPLGRHAVAELRGSGGGGMFSGVTRLIWHKLPIIETVFLRKRADYCRYAAAAAGGWLLSLAFPNAGVAGFAWIAPAVILFSALGASGATAFRCGFWGGMTFWLASLSWLLAIPYRWGGRCRSRRRLDGSP